MAKNILILTGSPRKGGNTDLLADAFAKGAAAAGHTVARFDSGRARIGGCVDCKTCFSNEGKACSFDDDFNALAPLIAQADAIVFAAPLYFFTFPAQIKAAIDKLYAFFVAGKPLKIKESAFIACGETDDPAHFKGMVETYQIMAGFLGWADKGRIIATGVHTKGDVLGTPFLQQAEALGSAL